MTHAKLAKRIMVSWGLISMGMALTRDETGFYVLRFLLGVAEAGFFPGIILYLTDWVLIGRHSDRRGERPWHIAGSLALAAAGSLLAAGAHTLAPALLAFSLAAVGVWGVMGPFWALATSFLSATAAAGGIALINSLGNVGGFVGPYLMGWFKQETAGYGTGLVAVAGVLLLGGVLVLRVRAAR